MSFRTEEICEAFVYLDSDDYWRAVVNDLDLDNVFNSRGAAVDALHKWTQQRGLSLEIPVFKIHRTIEE